MCRFDPISAATVTSFVTASRITIASPSRCPHTQPALIPAFPLHSSGRGRRASYGPRGSLLMPRVGTGQLVGDQVAVTEVEEASTDDSDIKKRNNSTSLRRALLILTNIADRNNEPGGLTLGELATSMDLHKSTVIRLIAPLVEAHLLEKVNGRYRLGSTTAYLGSIYLERLDLRTVSHESLIQLMERSGETVHLAIFEVPEVVYLDKVESLQTVRMYSRVGARQPAYSTSVGKVFLAYGTERDLRQVIDTGLLRRTPNTMTSEEELRADLKVTRTRGYGIDNVENEQGIRCLGAPIFDHTGGVVAAVSISGPSSRVTYERVAELGRLVVDGSTDISRRLGYQSHVAF